MDAIQRFTENIVRTTYEMLPAAALAATETSLSLILMGSMRGGLHGSSGTS